MIRSPIQPRLIHRLVALLSVAALSSACENGTVEPENPTVTGNWVGTGVSAGALEEWSFDLEEAPAGTVTGSFVLRVERLVFSGTLSGTHEYPALLLDLDMTFFGQIVSGSYRGQLTSPESIEGEYQLVDDPQTLDLERLGT
ncbi:MAG: hypothetical protein F4Z31_22330 [Gemmatimonadetes bacterium]|nr:hypothetical protein [Gemmatimonadota bacterium]MYA44475.1 hypothetical protein [Gemmatimonadota bacterium]MYE94419.1 hypothetical protein [Gemmatimonadota bacterium]MYJ08709.1 hypothetical protein [Gemmatimonadota bacterium]